MYSINAKKLSIVFAGLILMVSFQNCGKGFSSIETTNQSSTGAGTDTGQSNEEPSTNTDIPVTPTPPVDVNPMPAAQLPSGYFVPQKFPMTVVFPRPDSETGSFAAGNAYAFHRWAYYDGIHSIEKAFALTVYGGSAPHMFRIVSAPTGATIGNVYGDKFNHGVLRWTPQQAYPISAPASFVVEIRGQDGHSIQISWTTATASGTDRFVFISPTNNPSPGADSNAGTITAPFRTLAKVMGTSKNQTTYPGRQVILRAGNYTMTAHSDAWNAGNAGETQPARVELTRSRHPIVYTAFPGETPIIDFSGAEIHFGGNNDNAHDFYFGGSGSSYIQVNGSSVNADETHNFWGHNANRISFQRIHFSGFIPKVAGNFTNSTPIFTSSASPRREYWSLHGVVDDNRPNVATGNDGALFVIFSINYWVDDYSVGATPGGGASLKDSVFYSSSRYQKIRQYEGTGEASRWYASCGAMNFMGQSGSAHNEILYSYLRGSLVFNNQGQAAEDMHSIRNTVFAEDTNSRYALRANQGLGNFTSTNDVLMASGVTVYDTMGNLLRIDPDLIDPLVTATGTEANRGWGAQNLMATFKSPIDPTSGMLVNITGDIQFKNLWRGKRGHEIWKP